MLTPVVCARVRAALGAVVVAVAGFIAVLAVPAAAHDVLLWSDPEAGERLEAGPERIVLGFDNEPLPVGTAIVVADGEDRDWVAGEPVVEGREVSVELEDGLPDAGFEVRWRVVSSDGHPISGIIPFTVGDGEPLSRDSAEPGSGPAGEAADDGAAPVGSSDQSSRSSGVLRTVLLGTAGAVAATGLFVMTIVLRRRPRADDAGSS